MADSVDDFPASLDSEMPQDNIKKLRDVPIFLRQDATEKIIALHHHTFPAGGSKLDVF
ncbi:hypothetical protein [Janthinobacterium sp. UMAB-60]|uniref:hypothetical protein n=1 Tax=Janthinobacterium sp. UMAB-60 TaxID=1365365 RepID=UPI001C568E31|nr:hypothetical protein [Janthinobacterium sp. UMAB-60]